VHTTLVAFDLEEHFPTIFMWYV